VAGAADVVEIAGGGGACAVAVLRGEDVVQRLGYQDTARGPQTGSAGAAAISGVAGRTAATPHTVDGWPPLSRSVGRSCRRCLALQRHAASGGGAGGRRGCLQSEDERLRGLRGLDAAGVERGAGGTGGGPGRGARGRGGTSWVETVGSDARCARGSGRATARFAAVSTTADTPPCTTPKASACCWQRR